MAEHDLAELIEGAVRMGLDDLVAEVTSKVVAEGWQAVNIDPATEISVSGRKGVMSGEVSVSPSGVVVNVAPTPDRADLDDSFLQWDCLSGAGTSFCFDAAGDIDGDNDVNLRDVRVLMLSFGGTTAP